MWKTWLFTEVLYDSADPVSFLLGLVSLIPVLLFLVLAVFVAVPTHLSRSAARLLMILLLNEACCQVAKRLMKQPRPFPPPWDRHLADARMQSLGHGWPSSHTAAIVCAATTSWLLAKQSYERFMLWRYGVWVVAAAVAVSRVYLGYHSKAQVLAGAALGAVDAFVLVRIPKRLSESVVRAVHSVTTV